MNVAVLAYGSPPVDTLLIVGATGKAGSAVTLHEVSPVTVLEPVPETISYPLDAVALTNN